MLFRVELCPEVIERQRLRTMHLNTNNNIQWCRHCDVNDSDHHQPNPNRTAGTGKP
jgi:hypothetical protein